MTESGDMKKASDSEAAQTLSPSWQWMLNIGVPAVYPGALLIFWLTPMHFGFGHDGVVIAGWVLGLSGLALWIVSTWHLGKSLAVLPGAKQLVTQGIYRFLRHPLYWGINFTLTGLALCLGSFWGLVYVAVLVLPLNYFRALKESQALEKQFGEAYRNWRSGTWF